jgi:hypothetical protein
LLLFLPRLLSTFPIRTPQGVLKKEETYYEEYQSVVLARFLGLTVKYARYGRFSTLSLSNEDE